MQRLKSILERISELTGSAMAWLTVLMVLGTFVIVVLRYVFDLGWIAMQESIVWMHAAVFMLGASYTLKHNEHVRVDIFYRGSSAQRRAWVNVVGTVVFLLPLAAFVAVTSWDYVSTSWAIREASREAGGLPFPFVPIMKSLIPATALLLMLQGIADLIGAVLVLTPGGEAGRRAGRPPERGDLMEWVALLMFAAVVAVLLAGYPVAFSLGGVALLFAWIGMALGIFDGAFLGTMPNRIYGIMSNETLMAVPLFVFMGVTLERAQIAESLLDSLSRLFGTLRGGLGISVTLVGMLLAASTGIVGATVVTMGLLALPTMLRRGYDPAVATGTICASGTLGQIIPPFHHPGAAGRRALLGLQPGAARRRYFLPPIPCL